MREMLRDLKVGLWNVPNALTMLRLALIPVFAIFYLTGRPFWALGVFCLASITDYLDGHLARKYNLITSFGKLFDPLADKLMVICAITCHVITGRFFWVPLVIVAVKELIMITGSTYMLSQGIVVYANMYGKVSTVLFIAAIILAFFHDSLPDWGPMKPHQWLLWISVAVTVTALCVYVRDARRALAAKHAAAPAEN